MVGCGLISCVVRFFVWYVRLELFDVVERFWCWLCLCWLGVSVCCWWVVLVFYWVCWNIFCCVYWLIYCCGVVLLCRCCCYGCRGLLFDFWIWWLRLWSWLLVGFWWFWRVWDWFRWSCGYLYWLVCGWCIGICWVWVFFLIVWWVGLVLCIVVWEWVVWWVFC